MNEDELENFILKYLSERKFLKTQKKFSLETSSNRKRRKSHANNFILEERFEKLKKHFFNVKENDNNNSKTVNDEDSSGSDTDFEEIDNFYRAQNRNGIKICSYEWYAAIPKIPCLLASGST